MENNCIFLFKLSFFYIEAFFEYFFFDFIFSTKFFLTIFLFSKKQKQKYFTNCLQKLLIKRIKFLSLKSFLNNFIRVFVRYPIVKCIFYFCSLSDNIDLTFSEEKSFLCCALVELSQGIFLPYTFCKYQDYFSNAQRLL